MKKRIICLLVALALSLCPVAAFAEPASSVGATSETSSESLFFTQSELESVGKSDTKMHPAVWIFVSAGIGALITVAVIINMGKSRAND